MNFKNTIIFGPSVIFVICLFALWEILNIVFNINVRVLPSPTDIFKSLFSNWSVILGHTSKTFLEALIGLTFAFFLGVGTALLLDTSSFIRKTLYPLLVASQTVPLIALAPLLLLWFGFGITPKIIMVTLYCFFPIAIATSGGLARTDSDLVKLLASMKASYWHSMRFVRLPSALPSLFAGLKIAATYAVAGAIVGEFVGGEKGLGVLMQTASHSFATDLVFAAVIITVFLSIILFWTIVILEKYFVRWK